ncbi:hypothetical protein KM043_005987 [Ampulex compressa]|nr:hypothetical protein KM043_005987 [Ampulex compressa]
MTVERGREEIQKAEEAGEPGGVLITSRDFNGGLGGRVENAVGDVPQESSALAECISPSSAAERPVDLLCMELMYRTSVGRLLEARRRVFVPLKWRAAHQGR